MLSKYEAIGIFGSIAVMALLLAVIRFDLTSRPYFSGVEGSSQGAVVTVAADSENKDAALVAAITEAASSNGKLQKLIVDDIRIGTEGRVVAEGDRVTVHYEGVTQDGVRFDSSYARGETFSFTVGAGRVIEGWEKGLVGMKVGGQRVLVIPPHMAYGSAQVGPIPANATLVFNIELLSIE